MEDNVDAWIHGHTHNSFDYTVCGETRVICNPRGYALSDDCWENESFDSLMVVEV